MDAVLSIVILTIDENEINQTRPHRNQPDLQPLDMFKKIIDQGLDG